MKTLSRFFTTFLLSTLVFSTISNSQPIPIACYPFNGDALDASGNNHHGSPQNGAHLTFDRFGNPGASFEFDGIDDFIDIGLFGNILTGDELTFVFWARTTQYALNSPILMVPNNNSDRLNIHIYYDNSGTPSTFWDYGNISSGGRLVLGNVPFQTTWEHYAFVVSASLDSMKIYKNGILQGAKNNISTLVNRNKNVQIGGGISGITNCHFHGQIDDFQIYDVALSAGDVYDNFVNSSTCANTIFNYIKGKVYFDLNSNSSFDVGEPVVPNSLIVETTTSRTCYTYSNGDYIMGIDTIGTFEIIPTVYQQYFSILPQTNTATFSSMGEIDSLNDFALQPTGSFNDLRVTISALTPFRPGFISKYNLHYENIGTTTLGGDLVFYNDSLLTYSSSNVTPSTISNDSIMWNISPLLPFESGNIEVSTVLLIGTPNNTLLNSTAKIEPVLGDENPIDNYSFWEVFSTGSYDPNDIRVNKHFIDISEVNNPPTLNYIIRFQNTGNDTAFTVRIENTLPIELAENTFEFISSTHPCVIEYNSITRTFNFSHYNILLPDSNINEPLSHGNIVYRIKPSIGLLLNTHIFNEAGIYFDFNAPVITNQAETQITNITGQSSHSDDVIINIFPNPAKDFVVVETIDSKFNSFRIDISDTHGKNIISNLTLESDHINIQSLNSGVYFLKIYCEKTVIVKKIIKY